MEISIFDLPINTKELILPQLLEFERKKSEYILGGFDYFLTDIDEERDIEQKVAPLLGVQYLKENLTDTKLKITDGIIYGENSRCFVNLVCQYSDKAPLNVIFLIEPGSLFTFLTDKTLLALTGEAHTPGITIDGWQNQYIKKSNFKGSHFKNVNILGGGFLYPSYLLTLDYKNRKIKLISNS